MYVCECECVGVCVADTEPGPSLPTPPSADVVRATVRRRQAPGAPCSLRDGLQRNVARG